MKAFEVGIWVALGLACTALTIYHVYLVVRTYDGFPTNLEVFYKSEVALKYPDVIICPQDLPNPQGPELDLPPPTVQIETVNGTDPHLSLPKTVQIEPINSQKIMEIKCENLISNCVRQGKMVDCCERAEIVETSYGKCIFMPWNQRNVTSLGSGPQGSLSIQIAYDQAGAESGLNESHDASEAEVKWSPSYWVFLVDRWMYAPYGGVPVKAGEQASIGFKMVQSRDIVKKPANIFDRLGFVKKSGSQPSDLAARKPDCYSLCLVSIVQVVCSCIPPYAPRAWRELEAEVEVTKPFCTESQMENCAGKVQNEEGMGFCHTDCRQTLGVSETLFDLEGVAVSSTSEKSTKISLFYANMVVELRETSLLYTISDLVKDIGQVISIFVVLFLILFGLGQLIKLLVKCCRNRRIMKSDVNY